MVYRLGKIVGKKVMTNGKKVYVDIKPINKEDNMRQQGSLSNLEVLNPIASADLWTRYPKNVQYNLRGKKVTLKPY